MMNPTCPSRIYLLRHAKAAWAQPGERDFDRSLNDEGYGEAEVIADKAADRNYRPDRVVSSTATRCRQTAEAVRRAMSEELDIAFVDELYNAPVDTYLELVSTNGTASVMFIGHNPTIEEVLERLAGRDQMVSAIPGGFPTAGLAVLDRPSPAEDRYWRLIDFLTA
jgi:phosphohistidine phosphatase